ncbi:MAG: efflux RND transporter periplasmic adaptor subunit [Lewinella sp.]
MRIINYLLLGFSILVLGSCKEEVAAVGNGASTAKVMQADYVVLEARPIANKISLTGTLMAGESAMLSAQTSGLIKSIHFQEGERVAKGQLLVKLDDRQWVAQRQKLEAQLQTAKTNLTRQEELLKIKGISQAEVDNAALQVATIEADQQELEVMIDYALIRAPFSGQVGLRSVSPGAYLQVGAPVARLVQLDPLKLEFNVPERYANQIKKGQSVRFTVAGQDASYEGTVYASEPVINETTRALSIRARVPNRGGELIAGAFAEVNLTLDSIPDALLIPTEAVIPQLDNQIVYQIRDGAIHATTVKPGVRLPRLLQIQEGLSAGDTVMVVGLLQAADGMKVEAGKEIVVEKMDN